MSVAAVGTSATRLPPSAVTRETTQQSKLDGMRPNTIQNDVKMFNQIFRGISNTPQKLPTSRIPAIVERMTRDTKATSAKKSKWYKGDNYVDPRTYSWKNLALFSDYQTHMYTEAGSVKSKCKK